MRRVLVPKARIALPALLLAAGWATPASAAIPGATPCPGAAAYACSTVTVPLDRTGADPGTVALKVRTLVSTATAGARVALIPLAGGPGQAAIPIAKDFAASLAPGLQTRDLVDFDQRGTGESGKLSCGLGAGDDTEADAARACAKRLGRRRAHYTTLDSVADIEAIRVAGGYDKVALYGVSYGTKVALEYAATYPARVEKLVLDSTVVPEGPDPLQLSTFQAVPRALAQLCAGRCATITSNPGRDVATLVKRLAKHTLTGRYVDVDGKAHDVDITRNGLLNLLVAGDLNPGLRAAVPGAVAGALRGDLAPLARLRVRSAGGAVARPAPADATEDDGVDQALFVTTVCEELAFPWSRTASATTRARQAAQFVNRLPTAKVAPFDRDTAYTGGLLPLCVKWPVASPAPPASFTLPTTVPTLIVEGQQDLRTPVEDSLALAPRLGPATQVLQVPYTGHSVVGTDVSRCAEKAVGAFLADGATGDCSAVKPLVDVVRIAPRDVRTLARTDKVPGLAGQTLTAMLETLDDASQGLAVARFNGTRATALGGLRAGTLRVVSGGVRLRNDTYVPGVMVSGFVPNAAAKTATLTIGGPSAAHGTIKLNDRTLTGRLGGRKISLHAKAHAASAGARGWSAGAGPVAPFLRLARIR